MLSTIKTLNNKLYCFIERCGMDYMFLVFLSLMMLKTNLFLSIIYRPNLASIGLGYLYLLYITTPLRFFAHCLFIIFLLSFSFLLNSKKRLGYYLILDSLYSILLFLDTLYARKNGTFLSLALVRAKYNPLNISISNIKFVDIIFFIDILIVVLFFSINKKLYNHIYRNVTSFLLLTATSLIFMILSVYLADEKCATEQFYLKFRDWEPYITMYKASPLYYHLFDIERYFKENKQIKLTDTDLEEIKTWLKDNKEDIKDNKYKGLLKGKNLIFIQVESLEGFMINQSIDNQEITPTLNKLCKNGLLFTNYHEQVNRGISSDADLLSNTALYPISKGSTFYKYPYNSYPYSLPNLMESQGYNTVIMHAEKGGNWNWEPALKSIGFNKTITISDMDCDEYFCHMLSDETILRQFADKISKEKQPFYSTVVTLSSHGPFDYVPSAKHELKLEDNLNKSRLGLYLQSVRYVDTQIGKFLTLLDNKDLLKSSVIVIYGDHGGLNKYYSEEVNKLSSEFDWCKNPNSKIPLIIYNEDLKGEVIDTIGGQVDLLPTIAYLLGVDKETFNDKVIGKILVNTNKNYTILANGTVVGNPPNEKEKEHLIKGLQISNKILGSDYYYKYKD